MKYLDASEIIAAARESGMDEIETHRLVANIEAHVQKLANALAAHLGIGCGESEADEIAFGGLCTSFFALRHDQACPPCIEQFDTGGNWQTETGGDADPHPTAAPAAVKMTAAELLAKFLDMEGKHPSDEQESDSLLLDMACPECGHREGFRIGFHGTAEVDDDSSSDDGDHEWDADDHCTCQKCSHGGDVKDFTFPGLDDLIAKQEEPDQDTE